MQISQTSLRTLNVVFWILLMAFLSYNLHRKYQSISTCHNQLTQLDALEARIDGIKK